MNHPETFPNNGSGESAPEFQFSQQISQSGAQPEFEFVFAPPKPKYWLHFLLFALTFLSALIVGARMQDNFINLRPLFIGDQQYYALSWVLHEPSRLWMGMPFACALLGILFAHEMGHYLMCVRYGVWATLPYFIPFPSPAGTFGAFIQIQSPFERRSHLFDIAIGGPIAGFVVAVPVAVWGLAHSLPLIVHYDPEFPRLGMPAIFHVIYSGLHWVGAVAPGDVNVQDIYYHPVAIAAWIGMLATMLNLLPGGQLDGGHILHALNAKLHKAGTWLSILGMLALSYWLWTGWLIWAFGLFITRKHPAVAEEPGLDIGRKWMAVCALMLFALTFMPAPISLNSLPDVWHQVTGK